MKNFLSFLNKAVTQYHATEELANILRENGYVELFEENLSSTMFVRH